MTNAGYGIAPLVRVFKKTENISLDHIFQCSQNIPGELQGPTSVVNDLHPSLDDQARVWSRLSPRISTGSCFYGDQGWYHTIRFSELDSPLWISTQHSFPMKGSEVPSWDLVPPERIGDKAPFYPNPRSGRAVVTSLCRIDKHH